MSEISNTAIIIGVGVAFLACFAIIYYVWNKSKSVEQYGGPIKNVYRVSQTDCQSMCDRWTNHCLVTRPYDNSDNRCQRSGLACKYSCYYSNMQRF
jgi:hypothetical protein